MPQIQTLLARTGVALKLRSYQTIKIINTHGSQIVDFWALSTSNPSECLSMSHTHAILRKLTPCVGDTLYSNTSSPMLSFTEDTTKGDHDTLIAACNPARYEMMGAQGWHASCEENYLSAIQAVGEMGGFPRTAPAPINLFMNAHVEGDGKIVYEKPTSEKEQFVCFKALIDVVVVLSACPMDVRATSDWLPEPRDVEWEILGEE